MHGDMKILLHRVDEMPVIHMSLLQLAISDTTR